MIAYSTKLTAKNQEDFSSLMQILEWQRFVVNEAYKLQLGGKNSLIDIHAKVYRKMRGANPEIPAQVVIKAEQECLSTYRRISSLDQKIKRAPVKKALNMFLDKHLYSYTKNDATVIKITTSQGRKPFHFYVYPKLQSLLKKNKHRDPLIYERDGQLWIQFSFETNAPPIESPKMALGVDLGIRVPAACSDGRLIIDKKFNAEKRRLRYLKRCLQSKGTKSSRRHLKKLRRKERNKNRNQTHAIANAILKTDADTIAVENLKGLKASRGKFQSNNRISQVPLYDLREKLTYKALLLGKRVVAVNPAYTSQTDSLTGKREGERKGRRFYCKNGLVLDADLNAARNIGFRSKLPVSYGNVLDGQGVVIHPHVCKSLALMG